MRISLAHESLYALYWALMHAGKRAEADEICVMCSRLRVMATELAPGAVKAEVAR